MRSAPLAAPALKRIGDAFNLSCDILLICYYTLPQPSPADESLFCVILPRLHILHITALCRKTSISNLGSSLFVIHFTGEFTSDAFSFLAIDSPPLPGEDLSFVFSTEFVCLVPTITKLVNVSVKSELCILRIFFGNKLRSVNLSKLFIHALSRR